MKDERLRELERAAASGDLGAAVEHARLRIRLGQACPSELTIGAPFPCALPAPIWGTWQQAAPRAWWRSRTLQIEGEESPRRLGLLLDPRLRDLEAVHEAHWRWATPARRGQREPVRIAEAGEGWIVSYEARGRWRHSYFVHALLHPRHGTLWWRDDTARLDLSGVWLGEPPPAAAGGWVLWLGDEGHLELTRALRELLQLDLPTVARLRKRLGGPCLRGERLTLSLLAELLREVRGLPAEALWLSVLPPGLFEVELPEPALWDTARESGHPLPQLGQLRLGAEAGQGSA